MYECTGLTDLSGLKNLKNLEYLEIEKCGKIKDISVVSNLTELTMFSLSECGGLTDISALGSLNNLNTMAIENCIGITDLSWISNLKKISTLGIEGCDGITDISALSNLTNMDWLGIVDCDGITDISALRNMTEMMWLEITGCDGIKDISVISNMKSIALLTLNDCDGITDISALSNLTELMWLELTDCDGITNISGLSNLTNLLTLNISDCDGITNISGLGNLTKLEVLNIENTHGITDFTFVSSLPKLKDNSKLGPTYSKLRLSVANDLSKYTIINDVRDEKGNYVAPIASELYSYDKNTNKITLHLDKIKSSDIEIKYDFCVYNKRGLKINVGHNKKINIVKKEVYETLQGTLKINNSINNISTNKGDTVTLTTSAIGGSGNYTYKYAVLNVDTGKWSVLKDFSSSNTYTYALNYPGKKQFAVTVKDSKGNTVATNRITVTVYENLSAKLTVNGSTNALTKAKGSKITLTPVVTGGIGGYTYKYAVLNVDTGKWSVLKDFSTAKTYTYSLDYPGKKAFAVAVQDNKGNTVATNRINVTVK